MKQHLFIFLLFLTGLVHLSLSIKRKFYFYQTPKSWSDAQTFCRTTHIDLATIENAAEVDQLNAETNRYNFGGWAWIGLYMDLSDYVWSYGSQKMGTATFWESGEPNGGTLELCMSVYTNSWFDDPCAILQPFICMDDNNIGNDRYVYYSTYKTWNDAQSFCRLNHTDLASARDANEISIITAKVTVTNMHTWIGLYKNAHKWSDHTPYTSFTMMAGEPNNPSDMCICTYNGLGIDSSCPNTYSFFCYRAVTAQQRYIKLKIEFEQDVDRAALLQKILQKLEEHQINNVTVTWR